jgi:hypothetical protein
MTQEEQLEYVLPKKSVGKTEFLWHFKRYIWESE